MPGLSAGHGIVGHESIHDITGSSGAEAEIPDDGDDTVVEAAGSEGLVYRFGRAKIAVFVYPVGPLTSPRAVPVSCSAGATAAGSKIEADGA